MRHHRNSEYTCGLWHDSLLADLAWSVDDHPPPEQEWPSLDEGDFPSWSWCSVNMRCVYGYEIVCEWEDHKDAKVLNVSAPALALSPSATDASAASIRAGCIALDWRLFDLPEQSLADDLHFGDIRPPSFNIRPDYNWSPPPGGTEALHLVALGTLRFAALGHKYVYFAGILLYCVDRRQGLYKRLGRLMLRSFPEDAGTTSPGSEKLTCETGDGLRWGGGLLGEGRITIVNLVLGGTPQRHLCVYIVSRLFGSLKAPLPCPYAIRGGGRLVEASDGSVADRISFKCRLRRRPIPIPASGRLQ